jgi:hypothetical protein
LPVWAANTTRFSCPPSVSAVISTVPVAPASGAFRVRVGSASGAPSGLAAFSTRAPSAGTVTSMLLSPPLRTVASPPWSAAKSMPAEPVGTLTVFAPAALFTATTYSVRVFGSVREKAYTEPSAWRCSWMPSRSAGWALVSFASAAIWR